MRIFWLVLALVAAFGAAVSYLAGDVFAFGVNAGMLVFDMFMFESAE